MAHIELVDQTFRDGQQSLWGMRIRTGMLERAAPLLDRAGYRAVDITGSSMFECTVRYSRENPWEGFDLWRAWMPHVTLRSGVGSNRIGTLRAGQLVLKRGEAGAITHTATVAGA